MDDSDEDFTQSSTSNTNQDDELDYNTREKMVKNEMRSFRNRGFHDGYDEGKKAVIQQAFDTGYQKAFEQNFILSTLKGIAHALKSSYNLNSATAIDTTSARPTSIPSSSSSKLTSSTNINSPPSPRSKPGSLFGSRSIVGSKSRSLPLAGDSSAGSSCSSSSNVSNTTAGSSNFNVNISSNHLLLLESMKFDDAENIESIKNDLIKICRENRLEILAHYVSHIG